MDTPLPNPCRPCFAGAEPSATLHRRRQDSTKPESKITQIYDVPTDGVVLLNVHSRVESDAGAATTVMLVISFCLVLI